MNFLSKVVLSTTIVASPAFVFGNSQICEFLRDGQSRNLSNIISFLDQHRYDLSWCNSITIEFDVAKTLQTSAHDWQKVSGIFITLINRMEHAQKSEDMVWLDLLGSPAKELILASGSDKGIPGSLDGRIGNVVSLELKLERTDSCVPANWFRVMDIVLNYLNELQNALNSQDFSLATKNIGVPLKTVLETANIGKSLCITFKDQEGYSLYCKFVNKD